LTLPRVALDGPEELVEVPLDEQVYGVAVIEGMGSYSFGWRATGEASPGILVPVFPRGKVTLRVADESGTPLPGVPMWYRRQRSEGAEPDARIPSSGQAVSDAQGLVTLTEIPYGTYTVRLNRRPDAPVAATFVVGGADAAVAQIQLKGMTTLAGTWKLPEFLMDGTPPSVRVLGGSIAVDAPGEPDGTWSVTLPITSGEALRVALRHRRQSLGPARQALSGASGVDLDYSTIRRIALDLRSRGGKRTRGTALRLKGVDGDAGYQITTQVARDGTASVLGVPEGAYQVLISRDSFQADVRELSVVEIVRTTERIELWTD
jgi:hypothetical protein